MTDSDRLDDLIKIAIRLQEIFIRRFWLVAGAIGIGMLALVIGAAMLFRQNSLVAENQKVAEQAYIQALMNNRDSLYARIHFSETRDCPIVYFRELLIIAQQRGDLTTVEPPCETDDVEAITRQINEVQARIDRAVAEAARS